MSNEFEETYDEPAAPAKPAAPKQKPGGGGIQIPLPWIVSGVVVIVAVVLVVYFAAIRNTSSSKTATGPTSTTSQTGSRYQVAYPKDWATVSPDTVAPGQHAFAAFRQKAGKGVVVMRLEGPVTLGTKYLKSLKAQLKRTVPDFRFVASHLLTIQGAQALDFTYQRTSLHEVRNVVVLPAGKFTVVMATIAPVGNATISKEISGIVDSFKLTS